MNNRRHWLILLPQYPSTRCGTKIVPLCHQNCAIVSPKQISFAATMTVVSPKQISFAATMTVVSPKQIHPWGPGFETRQRHGTEP